MCLDTPPSELWGSSFATMTVFLSFEEPLEIVISLLLLRFLTLGEAIDPRYPFEGLGMFLGTVFSTIFGNSDLFLRVFLERNRCLYYPSALIFCTPSLN